MNTVSPQSEGKTTTTAAICTAEAHEQPVAHVGQRAELFFKLLDSSWSTLSGIVLVRIDFHLLFMVLLHVGDSENIEFEQLAPLGAQRPGPFPVHWCSPPPISSLPGFVAASTSTYLGATLTQFTGVLINVFVFSVIVTKFQQPRGDVVFSKHVLITERDGIPHLL